MSSSSSPPSNVVDLTSDDAEEYSHPVDEKLGDILGVFAENHDSLLQEKRDKKSEPSINFASMVKRTVNVSTPHEHSDKCNHDNDDVKGLSASNQKNNYKSRISPTSSSSSSSMIVDQVLSDEDENIPKVLEGKRKNEESNNEPKLPSESKIPSISFIDLIKGITHLFRFMDVLFLLLNYPCTNAYILRAPIMYYEMANNIKFDWNNPIHKIDMLRIHSFLKVLANNMKGLGCKEMPPEFLYQLDQSKYGYKLFRNNEDCRLWVYCEVYSQVRTITESYSLEKDHWMANRDAPNPTNLADKEYDRPQRVGVASYIFGGVSFDSEGKVVYNFTRIKSVCEQFNLTSKSFCKDKGKIRRLLSTDVVLSVQKLLQNNSLFVDLMPETHNDAWTKQMIDVINSIDPDITVRRQYNIARSNNTKSSEPAEKKQRMNIEEQKKVCVCVSDGDSHKVLLVQDTGNYFNAIARLMKRIAENKLPANSKIINETTLANMLQESMEGDNDVFGIYVLSTEVYDSKSDTVSGIQVERDATRRYDLLVAAIDYERMAQCQCKGGCLTASHNGPCEGVMVIQNLCNQCIKTTCNCTADPGHCFSSSPHESGSCANVAFQTTLRCPSCARPSCSCSGLNGICKKAVSCKGKCNGTSRYANGQCLSCHDQPSCLCSGDNGICNKAVSCKGKCNGTRHFANGQCQACHDMPTCSCSGLKGVCNKTKSCKGKCTNRTKNANGKCGICHEVRVMCACPGGSACKRPRNCVGNCGTSSGINKSTKLCYRCDDKRK